MLPVTSFEGEPIGDGRPGPWTLRARADREAMIAGEDARMTRDELIAGTRQLIDEGDRLDRQPVAPLAPDVAQALG